jgi:hypothetical protein
MDAFRVVTEYSAITGIGLTRGGLLRIEDGRGTRVRVETGEVWITQAEDPNDVYLRAGESFLLDRDGVALLQACSRTPLTMVCIEPCNRSV